MADGHHSTVSHGPSHSPEKEPLTCPRAIEPAAALTFPETEGREAKQEEAKTRTQY